MNDEKPHNAELTPGALLNCPTCGLPAEITDRFTLAGAPEPVEHVKLMCVRRHWYTLPADVLSTICPVPEHTSHSRITRQRQPAPSTPPHPPRTGKRQ
jgi:hypothetical protein